MSGQGRFLGRVALVTGAGRGIGRAIALRLAEDGADIAANDVSQSDGLAEVVESIRSMGRHSTAFHADVSCLSDVEVMTARVMEEFGLLDILVNNAGVQTESPVLELDVEQWDRIFAVNARGTFLCSRTVAHAMREKNIRGKIVNVSSLCGQVPWPAFAHYCASKAAVDMLTRSLALELAPMGINVNAVAPGTILTEMSEFILSCDDLLAKNVALTPAGRLGTTDDVANAVAFLCSQEADWIHGHVLVVDGGFSLGLCTGL